MLIQLVIAALALLFLGWLILYLKTHRKAGASPGDTELTIMLGSGGHTGELCELLKNFDFQKIRSLNVLVTQTDKSSYNFFCSFLQNDQPQNFRLIQSKMKLYCLIRTNEVKQSYFSAVLTAGRSLLASSLLVARQLIKTTHFVANGPGTCVPLFYIFYVLKKLKLCRTKLIFFESWCRVQNLSLSGKLIRPIADQFVVHWPELAAKYPSCKYYGKII